MAFISTNHIAVFFCTDIFYDVPTYFNVTATPSRHIFTQGEISPGEMKSELGNIPGESNRINHWDVLLVSARERPATCTGTGPL